jgi:hypothetical protein
MLNPPCTGTYTAFLASSGGFDRIARGEYTAFGGESSCSGALRKTQFD